MFWLLLFCPKFCVTLRYSNHTPALRESLSWDNWEEASSQEGTLFNESSVPSWIQTEFLLQLVSSISHIHSSSSFSESSAGETFITKIWKLFCSIRESSWCWCSVEAVVNSTLPMMMMRVNLVFLKNTSTFWSSSVPPSPWCTLIYIQYTKYIM